MKTARKIARGALLAYLIVSTFLFGAPLEGLFWHIKDKNVVDILYQAAKDGNVVDVAFKEFVAPSLKEAYADGATDAMMVYDTLSGTSTPKYRIWNGSSWGSELSASDVNGTEIRHMQLKYAPNRDEAVLVVLTNNGQVQAQVFDGSSWGTAVTLSTLNDTNGSGDGGSLYRGFDVEYEQSSGDAVVVAADGTADPNYYVWNGSSWTGGADINIPTTGRPYWIELASRPGSDELAMITLDSSNDVYGMRWTGSAWDNMGVATTWDAAATTALRRTIDVAFETNSGDIMYLWGDSVTADDHNYRTYSGGALGTITALANANAGGQPYWIRLAPNPNPLSDQIMLGTLDSADDLSTYIWSGSAWSAVHTEHTAAVENADAEQDFEIVFETHSSNTDDAWLLWNNGSTVSRKLWNGPTAAWGSATTMGDDSAAIVMSAHPNSGAVFAVVYEDDTSATDDIREAHLTSGSQTWSTIAQIWAGPVRRNIGAIRMSIASQAYNSSNEAMMAYVTEESTSYPQYRRWTGSSWGSQASTSPTNGEIRHLVVKAAPTRDEAMLVTLGNNGRVEAQVWNGSSGVWGSATLLNTMNNASGDRDLQSLYRGFDIEYENVSGDAIVVTGDGTADPNYHVWNGSSWAGPTNIDIPTTGRPNWIELSTRPGSDEMAMILVDSAADVYGMRWTGSAWDNMGTAAAWDTTAAIATEKDVDVAFETNSGDIMFIWGDSVSTDQYYRTYSGGTLSAATLLDNAQAGAVNNWMVLAPNPGASSDEIMFGVLDGGSDLNTFMWSGSAWSAVHAEHSGATESNSNQNFDIEFETHSSNPDDAWLVWGDGNTVSRKLWNGATDTWGTATTQGDDTDYLALNSHPNSGAMFLTAYESSASASDDITENRLTGGGQTWGTAAPMWGGPVSRIGLPLTKIMIAPERYVLPSYTQSAYRFFGNSNSTDVGSALAAQDAPATLAAAGDAFRLRMLLHVADGQLYTNGQDFKLQFVDKGSGTCAAPSGGTPASYTDVTGATAIAFNNNATPSDGAALSANANDPLHGGDTIVNQSYEEANNFTASEAAIPAGQDGKWDFSLIDNGASAGTTFCFRAVKSNGIALDAYSEYPEVTTSSGGNSLPVASAVSIDSGAASITLTEGARKSVACVGTVTDSDGFADISSVTADLFRTSIGIGSALDDNDHYRLSGDSGCVPSGGSGTSETYTCTFAVEYFADATDAGSPNSTDTWTCTMTPSDAGGAGTAASDTIEVDSLIALDVTGSIDYGSLDPNTDSGSSNQTVAITNTGNRDMDPQISGTDMTGTGTILAGMQKYAAAAFIYASAGTTLSTTPTALDIALPQKTSATVTDDVYWGLGIPNGTPVGSYTGTITFTAAAGL